MKNKKTVTMIVGAALLLTACGSGTSGTDNAEEATETVAEITEAPTATPVQEPTATPTPEPTATPTPEPEPVAWFDEQGLEITPQGDFTFETILMSEDNRVIFDQETFGAKTIDVPSNVVISETTEGAEQGYKKVIAKYTCDYSAGAGYIAKGWTSAFDRYTGVSFEVDSETTYGDATKPGVVPIEYNGEVYEVYFEYSAEINGNTDTYIITVTCPEDYDGTVFNCGCSYKDQSEIYAQIDLKKGLHTIDEFPYFGDNPIYYYFSSSDQ